MTVTPKMVEAAWRVLTRYVGTDADAKRDPLSIGTVEVEKAIEAALAAQEK